MVNVLGNGFILLQQSLASDLDVVNAARVSFAKRSAELDDGAAALVGFLMRNKHGSPFEHNIFRFHVRAPIVVVREWERHRIASYNEQSGRYSELREVFYEPEFIRTQVGKPGHYRFESMSDTDVASVRGIIATHNRECYQRYQMLLDKGVAREQARLVLPPTLMVEFWVSMNARALMNFIALRNADTAMFEIRQYAIEVEKVFAQLMPLTHAAFVEQGRVAP